MILLQVDGSRGFEKVGSKIPLNYKWASLLWFKQDMFPQSFILLLSPQGFISSNCNNDCICKIDLMYNNIFDMPSLPFILNN